MPMMASFHLHIFISALEILSLKLLICESTDHVLEVSVIVYLGP